MQWTPSCRHVHSDRKHSLVDAAEAEIQRTWRELQHKWPQATRQHLQLKVGNTFLEGDEGTLFVDGRRAEVCYVLYRAEPRNGLLLHTKADYPAGCFRLPTGGVKPGEDVVGSLEREVFEETSLDLSQGCRTQFSRPAGLRFSNTTGCTSPAFYYLHFYRGSSTELLAGPFG